MQRFTYVKQLMQPMIAVVALVAATARSSAADDSVLNLIPRDAAGFIHIRVGDLWVHDSFKPVREFLTKETKDLRDIEKRFGFVPADVETLTFLFPEFDESIGSSFPLIFVRMNKPIDKPKLLKAMGAVSPAQMVEEFGFGQRWQAVPDNPPRVKMVPKPVFPGEKGPPFGPGSSEPKFTTPVPPKSFPPKEKFEEPQLAPSDEEPFEPNDPSDGRRQPAKPDLNAKRYIMDDGRRHLFIVDDRTILLGVGSEVPGGNNSLTVLCIQMLRRAEKGPLDLAIAEAAKKKTIVAGINVVELAKSAGKLAPNFERFRPLRSAKSAVLSLNVAEKMNVALTLEAANADEAKKIEDSLHALVGLAKESLPGLKKEAKKSATSELLLVLLDQGDKALEKVAIEQKGALVQATTSVQPDVAFNAALSAAIAQVKVAAARTQSQNNLKQLGLAVINYSDANARLPFPGTGKLGAPLGPGNNNPNLSWRVSILPYIEASDLYQQFKLDEPWDSDHNKKLIEKMPKIFAPVNGVKADKGHTFYQIFTGREAMQPGMRYPASFPDGTSNTLLIVESGDSVPWTRPEDMLYDSKKPLPKLGGLFNGDFNAAFADGSVRYIRKTIAEKTLRALITPAGGEVVDASDLDK